MGELVKKVLHKLWRIKRKRRRKEMFLVIVTQYFLFIHQRGN